MPRTYLRKGSSVPTLATATFSISKCSSSKVLGSNSENAFDGIQNRKSKKPDFVFSHDDDDSFDKLCSGFENLKVKNKKENIDPFDLLLENDENPRNGGPRSSIFLEDSGSPDLFPSPEVIIPSKECELFSSFSNQNEDSVKFKTTLEPNTFATPKLKQPNNMYRCNAKKSTNKKYPLKKPGPLKPKNPKCDLDDSALKTRLTFVKSGDLGSSSSLVGLSPSANSFYRRTDLLKTSTPMIGRSSTKKLSSMKLTEPEDDVFTPGLGLGSQVNSENPSSLTNLDPSPQKNLRHIYEEELEVSAVTRSTSSGIMKSKSLHGPEEVFEDNINLSFNPSNVNEHSEEEFGEVEEDGSINYSLSPSNVDEYPEEEFEEEEEESIYMKCICDNNESTDESVIQCNDCGWAFHISCCNLSEQDILDLETPGMTWSCPRCIQKAMDEAPDSSLQSDKLVGSPSRNTVVIDEDDENVVIEEDKDFAEVSMSVTAHLQAPHKNHVQEDEDSMFAKSLPVVDNDDVVDVSLSVTARLEALHKNHVEDDDDLMFVKPLPAKETAAIEKVGAKLHGDTIVVDEDDVGEVSLSVTARLEAFHKDHVDEDDDWIFAKPIPVKKTEPIEEVAARPGKNWRRSIAVSQRTFRAAAERSRVGAPRCSFIVVPALAKEGTKADDGPGQVGKRPQECGSTPPVSSFSAPTAENPVLPPVADYSVVSEADLSSHTVDISLVSGPYQNDALGNLLNLCSNQKVVSINEIYEDNILQSSKKVGEGAFGEVFLVNSPDTSSQPVLKVVPIGGELEVNGEEQTTFEDISSEVKISSILSKLREGKKNMTEGFVELRNCNVFKGKYPKSLLQLWDKFDDEKRSENDRPDFFPADQHFIALEYGNGGRDLEKFVFRHPGQAWAAWQQVAHTLAVAEQELSFEHRDLHWGNVLVKETKEKEVQYRLAGDTFTVDTEGVNISIIDFSLSRLSTGGHTIFSDKTSDPTLFTALGKDKPGGDYQFDIYRKMKYHNKEDWEKFSPKTNIFWLHYILDKMVDKDGVHYSKKCKSTTKVYKSGMKSLRSAHASLEDYNSATEYVRRQGRRIDQV